jgi:site-specific DNA-methyltransferase (adenine-specific)
MWATPQKLFDELNKEFNFTLDPCAIPENAKCEKFYTPEDDGLSKDWSNETVFCNPPYGREIGKWVKKCAETEGGATSDVITC